jgi:hypothetical protein
MLYITIRRLILAEIYLTYLLKLASKIYEATFAITPKTVPPIVHGIPTRTRIIVMVARALEHNPVAATTGLPPINNLLYRLNQFCFIAWSKVGLL